MTKNKEEKSNKINMKYISKIAGVSTSTVSRTLRNDPEASSCELRKGLKNKTSLSLRKPRHYHCL